MKPTERGIVVEGTLNGNQVKMGIEAESTQHILAVLTDLYSDPETAILREYATNARDAHIEAGVTRPIEVDLPTPLMPYLKVRDFGLGLTEADIERIYSQYGASTKRGTDEQTGMLGLGCKSALTYASQFVVTAVKNGERIAVAVSRDEDGGGSMTIVDRSKTTDGDGVEISIPVKRDHDLDSKAEELFKYWPEGSVLLNGEAPERFEGLRLSDDLYLIKHNESNYSTNRVYRHDPDARSLVVMGDVPYPVDDDYLADAKLPAGTTLVAFVPIGAVNFTPAREALMYTNLTKATLADLCVRVRKEIIDAVQREVDAAADHPAALAVVVEWSPYLNYTVSNFSYRDDPLPSAYTEPDPHATDGSITNRTLRVTPGKHKYYDYGSLSGYDSTGSIPVSQWPSTVWVEDFNPSDCSADHKRKLLKWAEDTGFDNPQRFVLCHGKCNRNPFIGDHQIVSYPDTIRPIRLNTTAGNARGYGSRLKGSYDAWTETTKDSYSGTQTLANTIRPNTPLIWTNASKWEGRQHAQQLSAIYPKFTFVVLSANRVTKFRRDFPKAVTFDEAVEAKRKAFVDGLSDDVKLALLMDHLGVRETYQAFDPVQIDDPDLREAVRVAKVSTAAAEAKAGTFGMPNLDDMKFAHPLKTHYPLIETKYGYYSTPPKPTPHMYLYLNLIYKHRKENA